MSETGHALDPDEPDLPGLVTRAQAGDARALEELLTRLRPVVARRCARFLPCRQDAEEATQDALLAIATHVKDYTGRGAFLGWVTVVASNSSRATYRTLRRRSVELATETAPQQWRDPRTTSVIAGTRLDLLDALDAMEVSNPALVEAFVLRDLGTLPYEQIAAILDVPVGTAKARIHAARRILRQRLVVRG